MAPIRAALLSLGLLAGNAAHAQDDDVSPLVPKGNGALFSKAEVKGDNVYFKPGKGITFQSTDKRFKLAIGMRAQFRYTLWEDPVAGLSHNFMIRRARMTMIGHMFGKNNTYKVELAFSPKDDKVTKDGFLSQTPLLTWSMTFKHMRDLNFRIGQYKIPYSIQRVVSSGKQQMVDRSLGNAEFNLDRDLGFDIQSKDLGGVNMLSYFAGIYFGDGRGLFDPTDFSMMYLARFEIAPTGNFKHMSEADFERTAPRLSIGAAYAYLDRAPRLRGNGGSKPDDGGSTNYHNVTADVTLKAYGFSTHSSFYYRQGKRNPGDSTDDNGDIIAPIAARNGLGYTLQAGYLLPHTNLELVARWGQNHALADSSMGDSSEVGGGMGYYFAGHPFKLQADVTHIYSATFDDGITQLRMQLQTSL